MVKYHCSKERRMVMSMYVLRYLKTNADVNEKCEKGAATLFQGAQNGHVHKCIVLLKNNANVSEKWEDGTTPLFQAAQNGHENIYVPCY